MTGNWSDCRRVNNGVFSPQDFDVFHHLVFGPIVTLSLTREMFAQFDDLDDHFPTEKLKLGHLKNILRELERQRLSPSADKPTMF